MHHLKQPRLNHIESKILAHLPPIAKRCTAHHTEVVWTAGRGGESCHWRTPLPIRRKLIVKEDEGEDSKDNSSADMYTEPNYERRETYGKDAWEHVGRKLAVLHKKDGQHA